MTVDQVVKPPTPQRAGGYVRISEDAAGLEKGVTRQAEDVTALAQRLGWKMLKIYEENDTSAYKRRRIVMPDGRSVWRVVRPEFAQMLRDYEDSVIDGIIVYDLDRLVRQPRDLEDLIDLVDHFCLPVIGVTGSLDLMSDGGKTMARVLVAMANKSSADTARRVSRAMLQKALDGSTTGTFRSFGWMQDGITLEPAEADLRRRTARGFLAGESWSSLTAMIEGTGIPTVRGGRWRIRTVKTMIVSPRMAGIATYSGQVLRDERGEYVRGAWQPIITIDEWEAIVAEQGRRHEGKEFTTKNTRKHLLSGILRCGGLMNDGTLCNRTLVGKVNRYACPGHIDHGCGRIQRNMVKLDSLMEDLLFAHLEKNRPDETSFVEAPVPDTAEAAELNDVRQRLEMMRVGMRDGAVSIESFFAVVPALEKREKELTARRGKTKRVRAAQAQQLRTADEVRDEWSHATVSGKRAILGQYLVAVVVRPSQTRGIVFDHASIEPVWKPLPSAPL